MDLNVLHLTWEFPPHKVGGLGEHVYYLGRSLAKKGVNTHVVAYSSVTSYDTQENFHISKFNSYLPSENFLSWAILMSQYMKMKGAQVMRENDIDVIHAHDWLSALAGISLKHMFKKPLIATIHSTEYGRRNGIHEPFQNVVHQIEYKLSYEAWRIICCSYFMKNEIQNIFSCPGDKINVIPNGVDESKFMFPFNYNIRSKYAYPWERIVLYVGRLFPEKGCDLLLGAAPFILKRHPNAKFVIAGEGYMRSKFMHDANFMGLRDKCYFTGYLDEYSLRSLFRMADIVAVPSRYEPFGIVALEGMACEKPVVVSDTGGLSEIVWHDYDGIKVRPNHSESLAGGINRVLNNEEHSRWLGRNAIKKIREKYNWLKISQDTINIYKDILNQNNGGDWK